MTHPSKPSTTRHLSLRALINAAAIVLIATVTPTHAQALSAEDIVRKEVDAFYESGKAFQAKVAMRLLTAKGSARERTMDLWRINLGSDGDQRYMISFEAPADVRGMGFLVWKYPKKEADRWLYFPALKAIRRVAADDKRSSFVGSDFSYEDISGRQVDEEQHTLLRQEKLDDRDAYVIESRPKTPATYDKRLIWIDTERWLPLKEEYYDAEGKLQRVFKAEKVEQVGGYWTVTSRSMLTTATGHRTVVDFADVRYDVPLSDDLFTERSLRNPPPLRQ
jgi:outer membrane lipoprotein-sorting protein